MIQPRCTYRVQLRPGFGFGEAAAIVGYLADLGVSHLYTSPILQAVAGSEHGYDVVDHASLSADLGGAQGFAALTAELERGGLGTLVDIVPNHMAIDPANKWWWDVLENGRSSRYALFFDVSWDPPEQKLKDTILLPVLAGHYGRELEAGALRLERQGGRVLLTYADRVYPIAPETIGGLLGRVAERTGSVEAGQLARLLGELPRVEHADPTTRLSRHRRKDDLLARLAHLCEDDDTISPAIDREVARLNGDIDALDDLLGRQHYRVAYWKSASKELDYRRFFDINDLIGLRVEDPAVFDAVHERIVELAQEGRIQGVRVDHVDGLRDPAAYVERLRGALGPDAWILVEKILHHDERLRDWPVEGTTGYESIDLIGGLFVDPSGEEKLSAAYGSYTGERRDFRQIRQEAKDEVMRTLLTADVERVVALFAQVCERHRRHRDHTRADLRDVLRDIAAALAVYRTYARAETGTVDDEDRRWIDGAIGTARRRRPDIDPELLRFVRSLLLLEIRGEVEDEMVMRFQQLSAPVTAKGVEDTALYRYSRLTARNEVGVDPGRWCVSAEELHRASRERLARHPRALLAGSTHDTKRSEDVRARIALLSEIPDQWAQAITRWSALNGRHATDGMPDREDEHLLYQTLVGAYPLSAERALAYMQKAVREAKRRTSWSAPAEPYENALAAFTAGVLADEAFTSDLAAFVEPLVGAGRLNSLAQTLLRLTLPGVPDIYQGTELWDQSLVDPDNRRPVDFDLRRRLLSELETLGPAQIIDRMEEGLPKLHVIRRALRLRARRPDVFASGRYEPLSVNGDRATHAVAFARGGAVAVIVPRLVLGLFGSRLGAPEAWGDTEVSLPQGTWCDELTGTAQKGGPRRVAEILDSFPVAMLVREPDAA